MAELALDELTELDFTPTLPCEHSQHGTTHTPPGEPAKYLIRAACEHCPDVRQYMICLFGYQRLMSPNTVIRCSACEQINENKPIIVLAVLP